MGLEFRKSSEIHPITTTENMDSHLTCPAIQLLTGKKDDNNVFLTF